MKIYWRKTKDLNHRYTLTGKHLSIIRRQNGDYVGRWDGIWNLPLKVIDWIKIAIKVDGKTYWLHENCKSFIYRLYDATHKYKVKDLRIKEDTFVFENIEAFFKSLKIKNPEGRKLKIFVVVKFNLRFDSNLIRYESHLRPIKNQIVIYDKKLNALVCRNSSRINYAGIFGTDIVPDDYYLGTFNNKLIDKADWKRKGTRDSNYGICCFKYETDNKEFNLKLFLASSSESLEMARKTFKLAKEDYEKDYQKKKRNYNYYVNQISRIKTDDPAFDKAFLSSKINLEMLTHYQKGIGLGILAGFPSFAFFFGRDLCWTSLGVNSAGYLSTARESLLLLAKYQKRKGPEKGRIPHEIRLNGKTYFPSIDSTLLFIMAVYDYYKWTGDKVFLQLINKNVKNALQWCFRKVEGGLIPHGAEEFLKGITWMDSHYRGKYAVEIQALYLKALECGEELEKEVKNKKFAKLCRDHLEGLKEKIIKKYWNPKRGFFYDRIKANNNKDDVLTVNPALLLMFGYADKEKAEKVLEKYESPDFTIPIGVRTRAKGERGYDPSSYHKGSVWPLTTCWVSAAEFMYGRKQKGYEYLKKLTSLLQKSATPGTIHEVLPGEENPKDPSKAVGCFIQAWSSALPIFLVIRFICGIDPYAHKNLVVIDPYVPKELGLIKLRNLRIGGSKLNIDYKNVRGKIEVDFINKGEPINIITPKYAFRLVKSHKVYI